MQGSYAPHDFGKQIDWKHNPYPALEWIVQLQQFAVEIDKQV